MEDDATFDQDPQLPGSSSRTEAIAARLMKEARGRSADAHNEAEQREAKRMKDTRFWRIQCNANGGSNLVRLTRKFDGRRTNLRSKYKEELQGTEFEGMKYKLFSVSLNRVMRHRR